MQLCQSCQLVPAELEYREAHSLCYLCAEVLEKAKDAGIDERLFGGRVGLPAEAAILMGGKARLERALVFPFLLVSAEDGSGTHKLLAALSSSPKSGPSMDCLRRVAATEIRTLYAHPAIVKMAWRRFGPTLLAPKRVPLRIAGGYLDPRLVAGFSRKQIEDYGLLPCRVLGRTLVAASPGPWPAAHRGWSEEFADAVRESVVRWVGHAAVIEVREVSTAVFQRAVSEAPWGERITFP